MRIFFIIILLFGFHKLLFCQLDSLFTNKELQITSILINNSNKIVSSNYGVFTISNKTKDLLDVDFSKTKSLIYKLFKDNDDKIWAGITDNKIINILLPQTQYKFSDYLLSNVIRDVKTDKNNIWVATLKGGLSALSKTNTNKYTNYLPFNNVNTIYFDKENQMLIGTDNGIYHFRDGELFRQAGVNYPTNLVNKIVGNDTIIYAGGFGRLWKYRYLTNEWEEILNNYSDEKKYTLRGNESKITLIKDMSLDSYGNLWIASDVIARYDINGKWKIIKKFKRDDATCIAVENDSIIWIGTRGNGIYSYKTKVREKVFNGNNLFLLVDNSGTMKKKTLKKVRRTLTMWLDYMGKDDKINLLSSKFVPYIKKDSLSSNKKVYLINNERFVVNDTILISSTASNKNEILKSFKKDIQRSVGRIGEYDKKIASTIKLTDDKIFEGANNRFIVTTDCGFNPDSLKNIVSDYFDDKDLHFSIISYKKFKKNNWLIINNNKISKPKKDELDTLTSSSEGKLYTIFDSKSYIFHEEFNVSRSFVNKFYIMPKIGVLNTTFYYSDYLLFAKDGKLIEKKINWYDYNEIVGGLDFGYIFNDYGLFKFGAFVGYEYNYYTTSFKADSYKNTYRDFDDSATSKDSLTKMTNAKNISENISLNRHYLTPKLMFRYGDKVEIFATIGLKVLLYSNNIYSGKGTFTYKGAYDEFGGTKLPFHDLPEYGYFTDTTFTSTGDSILPKTKLLNPVVSLGISLKLSSKFKVFANVTGIYTSYKEEPELKEYHLSKGVGNYSSVMLTKKFNHAISYGIEVGIAYKLSK